MTEQAADTAGLVRRLFDAKAATWPAKYAPDGRLAGRLAQLATAIGGHADAGCRVLDLGCGTGELARLLAHDGLKVTGCDISAQMLQGARQADPVDRVEWIRLDPGWRRLPFGDGTFGAVVASSVLEYVDDPVTVLRECARVLRPGGTLLCTVPEPGHPLRWAEWLVASLARLPLLRALGHRQRRLDGYLTYLRISRQRHSLRWWRAAGAHAALRLLPGSPTAARRSPLRLLGFQLTDAADDVPCRTRGDLQTPELI